VFQLLFMYRNIGFLTYLVTIMLFVSLISKPILAADMSGWSDKSVCRLAASNLESPEYVAEAHRRNLECGLSLRVVSSNSDSRPKPQKISLLDNEGVIFYPSKLTPEEMQQLLDIPIHKTSFDFSPYQVASLSTPIRCQFNLRRVLYSGGTQGSLERWNMAQGVIHFTTGGVNIEGNWLMGGLSQNSSYLKNEVNLKLTKTGHLVGKMAYFHLNVSNGEVVKNPLYVELKPHKRSKPLNITHPKDAELWTTVEDWAGGAWSLKRCKLMPG